MTSIPFDFANTKEEKIFSKNIESLSMSSSFLADKIINSKDLPLETVLARDGNLTAKVCGQWLHSRYSPTKEAENLASFALDSGKSTVILIGLGLGYVARAIVKKNINVIAVETEASILNSVFHVMDFSDLLVDDRFSLILCPQGTGFESLVTDVNLSSVKVIENSAIMSIFPENAEVIRNQIKKFSEKESINKATLKRFGSLWVKNLAKNLVFLANASDVSCTFGLYKNIPAIVLAAGPSLDDVLLHIKDLQKRFLIICVDTAINSLEKYDIEADFLVVVDPQYLNSRHLDRAKTQNTILVTEAAVWPSVLRNKYKASLLCTSIYPLGAYIDRECKINRGNLGAGGSVATTSCDFAIQAGCNDIFMAGLDLSFPDAKTHVKAGHFEQKSLTAGNRLFPSSLMSFLAMHNGQTFLADSNDGEKVLSDRRLALYSWWFTKKISSLLDTKIYNLSEHGLKIDGMPYKNVKDLLAFPIIREEINKKNAILVSQINKIDYKQRVRQIRDVISNLCKSLAYLETLSVEAIKIAKDNKNLSQEDKINKLDNIDKQILESSSKDIVGFLLSQEKDEVCGAAKNLDEVWNKTVILYSGIAKSASWHQKILKAALELVR